MLFVRTEEKGRSINLAHIRELYVEESDSDGKFKVKAIGEPLIIGETLDYNFYSLGTFATEVNALKYMNGLIDCINTQAPR